MISYLIKVIACSGLLWFVYVLYLEKVKMHQFNRVYLLFSVAFSLIVPLIPMSSGSTTIPVLENPVTELFYIPTENAVPVADTVVQTQEKTNPLLACLLALYCIVTLYFLIRLFFNIYRLITKDKGYRFVYHNNTKLIFMDENIVTHTFLNKIFLGKKDYTGETVEKEILTHELTHAQQKHSLDVIFIELVRSVFWFNPCFILFKKAIQLNHEFIADDAVIYTYKDVSAYQYLLLNKISQCSSNYLSSNLNFLIAKKRLAMMKKQKNKWVNTCSLFIAALMLTAAFTLFSEKTMAQETKKSPSPQPRISTDPVPRVTVPGKSGAGISDELLMEYTSAVNGAYKKRTAPNGEGYLIIDTTGVDIKRLRSIYASMTKEQQKKAPMLLGYVPVLPPPARKHPTEQQVKDWENASVYGVWLDYKKISNTELAKYKASDFDHFMVSRLYGRAKAGKTYSYQVNILTKAGYDKSYGKKLNQ
jgi:bla regulator protein BlaR1